jgi:hypothetical protein
MNDVSYALQNNKTIDNELDKAKRQERYKLKEDIKHRQRGVGLKKNKSI